MSDCVIFYVFSVNCNKVAVFVDFVRNQSFVIGNDYQFACAREGRVALVEFVEGVSVSVHFASDCFVVSSFEVEVHGFAFVHFNGEECFVSEVEYSYAGFFCFPQSRFVSIVGPSEVNFSGFWSVFTGNPNFVGLVGTIVVRNVYVVLHSLVGNSLPLFLQSNFEVYSFWHDFIGVFAVRSVVFSGSFVQFSFFYQVSNAGGFFNQVDGPVLVDVAGVVTVTNFYATIFYFIDVWFTDNVISTINFCKVNSYSYIFCCQNFTCIVCFL